MAKKKDDKKNKDNEKKSNLGIIIVVAVFAVLIIAVVMLINKDDSKDDEPKLNPVYNGYFFNQTGDYGLWSVVIKTQRGDVPVEFYYHPQQVENNTYDNNITEAVANIMLRKGKFLIGYDVNFSDKGVIAVAGSEVSKTTGKILGIETKSGFVESLGDEHIPVINCSLANYRTLVLEMRLSDENKIIYDDYCIVMHVKSPEDAVMLSDFMVYKWLGVIPSKTKTDSNSSADQSENSSASSVNASLNLSADSVSKKNINYSVNLS